MSANVHAADIASWYERNNLQRLRVFVGVVRDPIWWMRLAETEEQRSPMPKARNDAWSVAASLAGIAHSRWRGLWWGIIWHAGSFQLTVVAATATGASSRCLVVHFVGC
jgi:hypothetical protein